MSELLPPLPGAGQLDARLVEAAVDRVNTIYETGSLQTALAIGRTVLDVFFDGDLDAFASRGSAHLSFAAMVEHPDLRVDKTMVWRSVHILEQVEALPPEVVEQLTFTHHVKLLPLRRSGEKRAELARKAADEGWTVAVLHEQVGQARARSGNPVQRRGKHPVLKEVEALERKAEKLQALLASEPESMSEDEVARAVEKLERVQMSVQESRHDIVRRPLGPTGA